MLADMMRASALRMEALIDNIMDLARGRLGGGLTLNRAPELLEPVLQEVIGELVVAMPERVVVTDFALGEPINCDRGRIAQLFSNLLGNALFDPRVTEPTRSRASRERGGGLRTFGRQGGRGDPPV